MDLAKMTARVRHPVTSDGRDAGSSDMLTVYAEVSIGDSEDTFVVTSHTLSAHEILAAVENGMSARAVVSTSLYGEMTMYLPLMVITHTGGTMGSQIVFGTSQGGLQVAISEDGSEEWNFHMAV